MSKSEQDKLIGEHKMDEGHICSTWLSHKDKPTTDRKKHRELKEIKAKRDDAIKILAEYIIQHHISEKRIEHFERKKTILGKYEYSGYLKMQKLFPTADKTKKGNATEILLAEYLKFTSGLDLLIYRLRYNPNVDQSMKGDDVLLFNRKAPKSKILKGEAKFRSTPSKTVVDQIVSSCEKDKKLPVSISFVAEMLSINEEIELAEGLYEINLEMHKLSIPIVNVGLLLSNLNTSGYVEDHAGSDNPDFVYLSLGVDNPEEIINRIFELALEKMVCHENRKSV